MEPPEYDADAEEKHDWRKPANSPAWRTAGVSARSGRGNPASASTPTKNVASGRLSPALKTKEDTSKKLTGPRLIVFIAGGATYAELSRVHQISKMYGRQVIIGSTEMMSPKKYLALLETLC